MIKKTQALHVYPPALKGVLNGMWEIISGTIKRSLLVIAVQQTWKSSTFEPTCEVGWTILQPSKVWWVVEDI